MYVLYVQTHCCHWNVEGPHFSSLPVLFEDHYKDVHSGVDLIAERIRAFGLSTLLSVHELMSGAAIKDVSLPHGVKKMTVILLKGHDALITAI